MCRVILLFVLSLLKISAAWWDSEEPSKPSINQEGLVNSVVENRHKEINANLTDIKKDYRLTIIAAGTVIQTTITVLWAVHKIYKAQIRKAALKLPRN